MKKLLLPLLLAAVLLCGCGRQEEKPPETTLPPVETETAPEITAAPTEGEQDFTFGEIADWQFLFASGAGSWGTTMTVNPDGSFQGSLEDHDNETGEGYPEGTLHWCDFTGQFTQPEKIGDGIYAVRISDLQYAAEMGAEEIKNRMKYIADEARGLVDGEVFYFYRPGTAVDRLPEGFCQWTHVWPEEKQTLDFYGFYNEAQEFGFSSEEHAGPYGFAAMNALEAQEKALRTCLEADENLTQADMNDIAMEIYRLWDDKLNALWGDLKADLDAETMANLTQEQLDWISEKEAAAQSSGEEAGGGSLAPLASALKAAEMTKERVYILIRCFSWNSAAPAL